MGIEVPGSDTFKYAISERHTVDLLGRFTYHKPFGDQAARYEKIRDTALQFAFLLAGSCPDSRERSSALTHLQEVVMCANAAIAIHEVEA